MGKDSFVFFLDIVMFSCDVWSCSSRFVNMRGISLKIKLIFEDGKVEVWK